MIGVSISGIGALEDLRTRLGEAMPKQAQQAVKMGVREAIQRTRKKGLSIAKKRYAFSSYGRAKINALLAEKRQGPDRLFGEVRFKGEVGVPLRWFQTVPTRPTSAAKMPKIGKKTARVRVLRGGQMKEVFGPGGEKVFWWKHPKTENILLMYRVGRKLKNPDRMGASPIQAIQKQENTETIQEYLNAVMAERVGHQLSRMGG